MDFENLELAPMVTKERIYVSWTEAWDLDRYIDHYLREHDVPISAGTRAHLRQRIAKYPWPGPRKKADMDRYLDMNKS